MTHLDYPTAGEKLCIENGQLQVPDNPILGFIKGDGIGPDVMHACLRVWDSAVAQVYARQRKIYWQELFMGEAAAQRYQGAIFPEETRQALKDLIDLLRHKPSKNAEFENITDSKFFGFQLTH